ncbi:hypothetical protein HMPREF9370_0060 [Neisseria wadsworthii 9715]|uniref:Uncharacterized protein n=1 Tax=Neisseria wadsworthii 9715 TaxID=1030841 RepID=G4CLV1_9NEIS|nr:hypothetical protein HMPREF9370_0060 [Neisseria wadsworthii 9715]
MFESFNGKTKTLENQNVFSLKQPCLSEKAFRQAWPSGIYFTDNYVLFTMAT